jgi:hypothetical protein
LNAFNSCEKVGFSEKSRKSGNRKCLGDWEKSFVATNREFAWLGLQVARTNEDSERWQIERRTRCQRVPARCRLLRPCLIAHTSKHITPIAIAKPSHSFQATAQPQSIKMIITATLCQLTATAGFRLGKDCLPAINHNKVLRCRRAQSQSSMHSITLLTCMLAEQQIRAKNVNCYLLINALPDIESQIGV